MIGYLKWQAARFLLWLAVRVAPQDPNVRLMFLAAAADVTVDDEKEASD